MTRSRPAASCPNSAAERGRGWRVQSTPVVACAGEGLAGEGVVVGSRLAAPRAERDQLDAGAEAGHEPIERRGELALEALVGRLGHVPAAPEDLAEDHPDPRPPVRRAGRRRRSVERLERQVADREDVPRAELREARGAGRVPGRHQRDAPEVVRDRVDHVRTEQVADADAEQRHRPAQPERDPDPRQPVQGGNRAICLLADEVAAAQRDEVRAQRRPEQLAIGEAGIRGRRTAHGPGPEGSRRCRQGRGWRRSRPDRRAPDGGAAAGHRASPRRRGCSRRTSRSREPVDGVSRVEGTGVGL